MRQHGHAENGARGKPRRHVDLFAEPVVLPHIGHQRRLVILGHPPADADPHLKGDFAEPALIDAIGGGHAQHFFILGQLKIRAGFRLDRLASLVQHKLPELFRFVDKMQLVENFE